MLQKCESVWKDSYNGHVAVLIRNSDGIATSGVVETLGNFGSNFKGLPLKHF